MACREPLPLRDPWEGLPNPERTRPSYESDLILNQILPASPKRFGDRPLLGTSGAQLCGRPSRGRESKTHTRPTMRWRDASLWDRLLARLGRNQATHEQHVGVAIPDYATLQGHRGVPSGCIGQEGLHGRHADPPPQRGGGSMVEVAGPCSGRARAAWRAGTRVASLTHRLSLWGAQLWARSRRLFEAVQSSELRWLRRMTYSPRAVPEEE